jgi:TetR/AcrR family transcriptional repressor of nem operon
VRRRFGAVAARQRFGPVGWSSLQPTLPLEVVQIDHTLVDVVVVDELERLPLGRPRRYWEDSAAVLEKLLDKSSNPIHAMRQYPATFRKALENHNRICLCSFMAAEYDDLPEAVKKEVQTFADVNVAWLSKVLSAANVVSSEESESRARAIFSAVAGAQLMARSRSDLSLYDALINSYRVAGLLPA